MHILSVEKADSKQLSAYLKYTIRGDERLNYTDIGGLSVSAFLAKDALPVEGVLIRVRGTDEENGDFARSRVTDVDGRTEIIELPAPERELSQTPRPAEAPYATYTVEAHKPGYYSKVIEGVAVFGGAVTVLPINMIIYREGDPTPKDTLTTVSNENPKLEQ